MPYCTQCRASISNEVMASPRTHCKCGAPLPKTSAPVSPEPEGVPIEDFPLEEPPPEIPCDEAETIEDVDAAMLAASFDEPPKRKRRGR